MSKQLRLNMNDTLHFQTYSADLNIHFYSTAGQSSRYDADMSLREGKSWHGGIGVIGWTGIGIGATALLCCAVAAVCYCCWYKEHLAKQKAAPNDKPRESNPLLAHK